MMRIPTTIFPRRRFTHVAKSLAVTGLMAVILLGLPGCATPGIQVYADRSASPEVVPVPDVHNLSSSPDEPMVCVFAMREWRQYDFPILFLQTGQFHSFRFLTRQNANPLGCRVLVSIRQTGKSVFGVSYVDLYSPHGGTLLEEDRAEGHGGPWMGFQSVALYLKAGLAPGAPLRAKIDAPTNAAPLVGTAWVQQKAGSDLLDWNELLSGHGLGNVIAMHRIKPRLLAMRDADLAAPKEYENYLTPQQFDIVARHYKANRHKPAVPEEVRRYAILADDASRRGNLLEAVGDYEAGLRLAPWWPDGRYAIATVLGELRYYDEAIDQMNKYVALASDATRLRAAQDQIYRWQGEKSGVAVQ